jgi:hypothetical protein
MQAREQYAVVVARSRGNFERTARGFALHKLAQRLAQRCKMKQDADIRYSTSLANVLRHQQRRPLAVAVCRGFLLQPLLLLPVPPQEAETHGQQTALQTAGE